MGPKPLIGVRRDPRPASIAFADPLLEQHEGLKTSWFAGSETLATPQMLRTVVDLLRNALSPTRIIFAGSSTGAHPALLQA